MTHNEKNIYEHIVDGKKSHIGLVLRSSGLTERHVYMIILKLIDEGLISRDGCGKFECLKYL